MIEYVIFHLESVIPQVIEDFFIYFFNTVRYVIFLSYKQFYLGITSLLFLLLLFCGVKLENV